MQESLQNIFQSNNCMWSIFYVHNKYNEWNNNFENFIVLAFIEEILRIFLY